MKAPIAEEFEINAAAGTRRKSQSRKAHYADTVYYVKTHVDLPTLCAPVCPPHTRYWEGHTNMLYTITEITDVVIVARGDQI